MENYNSKDFLLFGLRHFQIGIVEEKGKIIHLEKGYTIEIEGQQLFKLIQNNQVIAPFKDVEELCQFVKMDMELNEEN